MRQWTITFVQICPTLPNSQAHLWLFFLQDIYLPNDTEVSFLIQCSRAYQRALRLVGVREPGVLHDFYPAFCACLAMLLSVLCRYVAAAGCYLCIALCGPSRNTGGGGGCTWSPLSVSFPYPPGALEVSFCSPPPIYSHHSIFVYRAGAVKFKGATPPPPLESSGPVGAGFPPKNSCIFFIPAH